MRNGLLSGRAINLPLAYDGRFVTLLRKFALGWDVTPAIRLGALAQKASNPGGVNLNTVVVRVETFGAERLWDFEVYARARLADGRLVLSANAFRYIMTDAQRTQTVTTLLPGGQAISSAAVANAPRAWSHGLELEAHWRPSARLRVSGAIGLLDTRINRTIQPNDRMLGRQFQRSPHFSGSASASWNPLPPVTLSAQARHSASCFSDDFETASRRIAPATTVDARAARTIRGVTLSGYVRNLFDAFHFTYIFDATLATEADPREIGIGLEGGVKANAPIGDEGC